MLSFISVACSVLLGFYKAGALSQLCPLLNVKEKERDALSQIQRVTGRE